MASKSRMSTRRSETAAHISSTPSKNRMLKELKGLEMDLINPYGTPSNRRTNSKSRQKSTRSRGPNPSTRKKQRGDQDSSDESDPVDDDHENEESCSGKDEIGDEDCDVSNLFDPDAMEIDDNMDNDKENRKTTRSSSAASLKRTPTRNLSKNASSQSEKKNKSSMVIRSAGRPTRSTKNQEIRVFNDDDDYSDELGDADLSDIVQKTKSITVKTPSKQPKKAAPIPKITLKVGQTPGGTRKVTKLTRPESDNEVKARTPIKLKIPLMSTADKMKYLSCRLHLSEVPEVLPCREAEAKDVRNFISQAIHPKYGESSAIYISGVPGTGKTATVRSVVEAMQKERKTPNFVYVEVNAMIFRKKVFVEIYNGIQESYSISTSKTKTPANGKIAATTARARLNTIFRKADPNRPSIVIMIDELDGLCNRKQDVLYDIFDWTAMPEARVTIIAISNTLDLPERMLNQRIMSRLDKRRLIFQPYDHEQISEIIHARLDGSDVIDKNAVLLVSRKVAAISGDLRQALDMLRRSIKVAIEKKAEKLCIEHVTAAQKAVTEPLKMRLLKSMRLHKFTLFRAVLTVLQETNQEETVFSESYKIYCTLCQTLYGINPVPGSDAYMMMLQLGRCSLVVLTGANIGMMRRKIKLGMSMSEAEKCVKEVGETRKDL